MHLEPDAIIRSCQSQVEPSVMPSLTRKFERTELIQSSPEDVFDILCPLLDRLGHLVDSSSNSGMHQMVLILGNGTRERQVVKLTIRPLPAGVSQLHITSTARRSNFGKHNGERIAQRLVYKLKLALGETR